jgi:MFS family permease
MSSSSPPLPGPKSWLAHPRTAVGLLLAINFVNYVDRTMLAALQSIIARDFREAGEPISKFAIGWLPTAFLLSYMLTSPVFGWMADRTSRWKIVGLGVILWSIASGSSGLATGYIALLLTRIFVGIGEAAYGPAAPTILADLYPPERRGGVLAWFYIAVPVGSALGYVWGGFVAHHFDWRWAFYLSLPPGILLGIWALSMPEPRHGKADDATVKRAARLSDLRTFWHTPSYVWNTLGMTFMTFAIGGLAFWMPEYVAEYRYPQDFAAEYGHWHAVGPETPQAELDRINDERDGVLKQVNMIFGGITVLSGIAATLAGGYTADALRRRFSGSYFLVSGIGMLVGVPLSLAVLVTPFPYCWGVIFLAEFCLFFNTGPSNTIIANVTHPAVRSTAYAVNIFIIHALGDVISPPLIGWVTDATGGNMNLGFGLVTTFAYLLSGVFWILGARHLARDTELAPTRLAD